MNLFRIFGRGTSAPAAKERLQILLAHERKSGCDSDLLGVLQKEVLNAIAKHIAIDADKVEVKLQRRESMSMLEIDIEIDAVAATSRQSSLTDEKAA